MRKVTWAHDEKDTEHSDKRNKKEQQKYKETDREIKQKTKQRMIRFKKKQ